MRTLRFTAALALLLLASVCHIDAAVTQLNVLSFGAIGDGVHDDTSAIQRAIDAVGTGSCVYLPGNGGPTGVGRYRVTAPLRLTHDVQTFRGDGSRVSTIYYDSGVAGSVVLVKASNAANSITQVQIEGLGISCVFGGFTRTGLELYDSRLCTISDVQTDMAGSNGLCEGLHTKGRDNGRVLGCNFQADKPIVIGTNPNVYISLDHWDFVDTSLVVLNASTVNPCVSVDANIYLSQSKMGGNQTWNGGVNGLVWHSPSAVFRSNGLRLSNVRWEQGTTTNGWMVDIEMGASGGSLLGNFIMDGVTFTDGFNNGVKLRGVVGASFTDVAFTQSTPSQRQLDADSTCTQISLQNCFVQQGGSISMAGLTNVFSSPTALGGTPMAETALWLPGTPSVEAQASAMSIAGGLRIGLTGTSAQGELYQQKYDDSTNVVWLQQLIRNRTSQTAVPRRWGGYMGEAISTNPGTILMEASYVAERKKSSVNYYGGYAIGVSTNAVGTFDPLNMEDGLYLDGENRALYHGGLHLAPDYFDGRKEAIGLWSQINDNTTAPSYPLVLDRHWTTTSATGRTNRITLVDTLPGNITNYLANITWTRLNSIANFAADLTFDVNLSPAVFPSTPDFLTPMVTLRSASGFVGLGGHDLVRVYTNGDLQIDGTLTVNTLNIDTFNANTIGVTNGVTASNVTATASMTLGGTTITAWPSSGGAGNSVVNTGASTVGQIPAATDLTGTNVAPSGASIVSGVLTAPTHLATKAFRSSQGTLTHAGTTTINFDATPSVASMSATGNVTFAFSNVAATRNYRLLLFNPQATNIMLTFPASHTGSTTNWVGGPPSTNMPPGTVAMWSNEAWGATDGDVKSAWGAMQ